MPPEVGAAALGLVWGTVCATLRIRRRPIVDAIWLLLSAAAVVAVSAWAAPGRAAPAAISAAAALPAGWLARRMLESLVEGRR